MTTATAILASPSRRRMAVLAASAALFTLVNSSFEVIAPLWATHELGFDNDGWAYLRALRMGGTCVGILLLGVIAEHLGSRRMVALALGAAGLALAGMAAGIHLAWLMPCFGAMVSATYVNFNALTQRVSDRRQGLANTLYRSVGAGMAILAPVAATQAAGCFGSYAPVIMCMAVVIAVAGLVIMAYPEPVAASRQSVSAVLAAYCRAFAQRQLLAFILLDQTFAIVTAAVGAFAALRFTRELGLSVPAFGLLCTVAAIGSLLVTLASAWLVHRYRLNTVMAVSWVGGSLAAIVLGISQDLTSSLIAFALFASMIAMTAVPSSMWVSRLAGDVSQTTVFTVYKLFQAGGVALIMVVLGLFEPLVGMATLFWCGGVLGLPLALLVARLPEPIADAGNPSPR